MPLNPHLLRSRATFEGGIPLRGSEGLEAMSVSCQMTSPDPERFRARVATATFGSTLVTRIRAQHMDATREGPMLDDFYSEFVQIGFPLAGSTLTAQGGDPRPAIPGDVTLLDDRQPFTSRITAPTEIVQFHLPRELMREFGLYPEAWSGRRAELTATGHVLRRALVTLTAHERDVASSARPFVGRAIRELAIGMLHEIGEGAPPVSELRAATRVRALQHIAENFADPDLDATSLAQRLGISRRHLYNVFEGDELGVAGRLRQARLRHAADLLAAPRSRVVPLAAVAAACGFRGADQFTRAFKRDYGMTPADYRAHVQEQSSAAR